MSFINGSAHIARFLVNGTLPENYAEELPKRIFRYAFKHLDENSDEERATGWVSIMDMFNSQLTEREFLHDPYVALSWRIDTRRVPSRALKEHCRKAEEDIKRMHDAEYLPKKQRQEIREGVLIQLLKRAIPRSRTYDMVWNLNTGVVLFGSPSNRIGGEFAEFFYKTFELHLTPVFPYSIAYDTLQKEGANPDLLDEVHPINLLEEQH
jgi:DNA recombination-dependent growth factor C